MTEFVKIIALYAQFITCYKMGEYGHVLPNDASRPFDDWCHLADTDRNYVIAERNEINKHKSKWLLYRLYIRGFKYYGFVASETCS
jgi:hypothetical protein